MGKHYKILIADDSPSFRNSVQVMFTEDTANTYTILMAENGREACTKSFHERPDLILMDIEMPVMNGIDAIRKIKENYMLKPIPVVVMSSTKQLQEAFNAGADDFLIKPFNAYGLLLRVQLNLNLAEKGTEIKKHQELLKEQKQEAIRQHDIIFKQKKDLMDDLNYARFVQNAIMPSVKELNDVFDGHFIFNRPKYVVSGDFYWMVRKQGYIMIAAGDCTGHGMSGALMTMAGVAFLNEIINTSHHFSADQILNDLRDKVIQLLNQKGEVGEASNGMDIALCVYNETSQIIQFAGANNPLYLVKKGGTLEVFKGDRMPIGFYFENNKSFIKTEIQLSKGDTIYLFSDGYPDQFGGPYEKKFRYNQFRELIENAAALSSMESQLELIQRTMDEWIQGFEQLDDMLVLGVKF